MPLLGFRATVYEEYIHEVRVGGKYCQGRERKYLNVCKVTINYIYRVLSVVPELPGLDFLLLRLSVSEDKHDHRLHRRRLQLTMVGVGCVVEGDPVELALVHVRHLVVLAPHAARGRGVQGVVEAEGGVHFGDLNLLRVRVPAAVVVPRLPDRVLVQDVLGRVRFLGELEARVAVDDASRGANLHKSCQWRKWGVCCMRLRLRYMHLNAIIRGGISSWSRFSSLTG